MTHYIKIGEQNVKVEMGCTHPDLKDNSTSTIGCDGKCDDCPYGKATMTIRDWLKLADQRFGY